MIVKLDGKYTTDFLKEFSESYLSNYTDFEAFTIRYDITVSETEEILTILFGTINYANN